VKGELAAAVGTRSQLMWGLRNADKKYDLSSDGMISIRQQAWDIGLAVRQDFRQLAYAIEDIVSALVRQGKIQQVFEQYQLSFEKPSTYQ
jgi:polar amino acid transport system substrate-binding protein